MDEWVQGTGIEPSAKSLSECRKTTIPSHHPVIDCTDYYSTNLAVLEIFQTAQLGFVSFFLSPKTCIHVFPRPQNMVFVCFCSISTKKTYQFMSSFPPKKILQIHATLSYFWDYKAGQKSRCQCRCQCQKATMSSQRPESSSRKYRKKHTYRRILLRWLGCNMFPKWWWTGDLPW